MKHLITIALLLIAAITSAQTNFEKRMQNALELFPNFKPETAFHPNWEKDRAEAVLKLCE